MAFSVFTTHTDCAAAAAAISNLQSPSQYVFLCKHFQYVSLISLYRENEKSAERRQAATHNANWNWCALNRSKET